MIKKFALLLPVLVLAGVVAWHFRVAGYAEAQGLPPRTVGLYWESFFSDRGYFRIDANRYLLTPGHYQALSKKLAGGEFEQFGGRVVSRDFGAGGFEAFTNHRVILSAENPAFLTALLELN